MQLRNDFTAETRELFTWKYDCDWCSRNNWSAVHHVLGRISNSPLNAATLHNFSCHIGNGKLATFEVQKILLQKTFEFLQTTQYELTDADKQFIKKNIRHYAAFLSDAALRGLLK